MFPLDSQGKDRNKPVRGSSYVLIFLVETEVPLLCNILIRPSNITISNTRIGLKEATIKALASNTFQYMDP